jgi:hypothetical protein
MRRFLDFLFGSLIRTLRFGAPVPVPLPVASSRANKPGRALLAFLFLFLAGSAPGRSCDVGPVSMWRLVLEADLIAVARVVKLEPRDVTYTSMEGEKETVEETDMHLAVQEIWKGEAPGSIVVAWSDGSLREGDLVLAMLQSEETLLGDSEDSADIIEALDEEDELTAEQRQWLALSESEWREAMRGRWQPQGGAGLRQVSESDLPVYSKRVREALALQATGEVSRESIRTWLIGMAERRATRLDAVLEMMYGEFAADWQVEGSDIRRAIDVLTEREIARIVDGFFAEPPGEEELLTMIAFFEGRSNAAFDFAVASAVEGLLARSRADEMTAEAIRAAVFRVTGDERPIDVHVTPDIDQLRSVWEEVRQRWGIPPAPAAAVPELPEPDRESIEQQF